MQWKPIESAPKDRTPVLLYSPDAAEPQIFVGCYQDDGGMNGEGAWYDQWRESGCFPIDSGPTHWIPLPKIPQM